MKGHSVPVKLSRMSIVDIEFVLSVDIGCCI